MKAPHDGTALRGTAGQFFRFALVGGLGFLVDSAILYLAAYKLGFNLYTGRVLSYVGAASATWCLNRLFTFAGARGRDRKRQWLRFLFVNLAGGLVNYGVYAAMVATVRAAHEEPVLAVAIGSLSGLAVNFYLSKRYVFGKSSASA